MIIISCVVAWYLIGLVSTIWGYTEEDSITVGDIPQVLGISLFGLIILIVIIAECYHVNKDTVLIKARKKK